MPGASTIIQLVYNLTVGIRYIFGLIFLAVPDSILISMRVVLVNFEYLGNQNPHIKGCRHSEHMVRATNVTNVFNK